MTITLRQLQVLSAVAATTSLGRAAKQLGSSQPAISQQLSKLEHHLGQRLVDREPRPLRLTKAGQLMLSKAEAILLTLKEAEVGLTEFVKGTRGHIAVGASTSLACALLTPASIELRNRHPNVQLELFEISPGDVVKQLLTRNFRMALLAKTTNVDQQARFAEVELAEDSYVLAAPKGVDLEDLHDLDRSLGTPVASLLHSVIGVDVEAVDAPQLYEWYDRFLPGCREVVRCSSYELALSMVEVRLGVAIVPMLAAQLNDHAIFDVELYRLPLPPYQISAILPSQLRRMQPYAALLEMLVDVGKRLPIARSRPPPPFLFARHDPIDKLAV